MAVDLLVTPLSKYWSGDYITPIMEDAWKMGATYNVITPKGMETIPADTPYGGANAKAEREKLIAFVEQIMDALPFQDASGAWNERSEHFGFHRVDPDCFRAIIKGADKQFTERVGLIGRLKGRKATVSHLSKALIFLPLEFDHPFHLEGKGFASLPKAWKELNAGDWCGVPQKGLAPIIEAFEEAIEANTPLVVDL